jgi:hypothetical protein
MPCMLKEALMRDSMIKTIIPAALLAFVFLSLTGTAGAAAREEILMGTVVKQGKRFVIEAEDGDYVVRGKDVSKMASKLVEATGIITENDKGSVIEVRRIEEVQDTQPD